MILNVQLYQSAERGLFTKFLRACRTNKIRLVLAGTMTGVYGAVRSYRIAQRDDAHRAYDLAFRVGLLEWFSDVVPRPVSGDALIDEAPLLRAYRRASRKRDACDASLRRSNDTLDVMRAKWREISSVCQAAFEALELAQAHNLRLWKQSRR